MTAYDTNEASKNTIFEAGQTISGGHIKAIYEELGAAPRGTSASVKQRLDSLITLSGVLDPGQNPPEGAPTGSLWFVRSVPVIEASFFGGASNHTTYSAQALTLTVPASTAVGDVGVLMVVWGNGTAYLSSAAPDYSGQGWSRISSTNTVITPTTPALGQETLNLSNNMGVALFVKELTAADGGTTLTLNSTPDAGVTIAGQRSATLMVFRGTQLSGGVFHKLATSTTSGSNTLPAPTVVPTAASIIGGFWGERLNYNSGNPSDLSVTSEAFWTSWTGASNGLVTGATANSLESSMGGFLSQDGNSLDVFSAGTLPTGAINWIRSSSLYPTAGSYYPRITFALEKKVG